MSRLQFQLLWILWGGNLQIKLNIYFLQYIHIFLSEKFKCFYTILRWCFFWFMPYFFVLQFSLNGSSDLRQEAWSENIHLDFQAAADTMHGQHVHTLHSMPQCQNPPHLCKNMFHFQRPWSLSVWLCTPWHTQSILILRLIKCGYNQGLMVYWSPLWDTGVLNNAIPWALMQYQSPFIPPASGACDCC